jgi:O-antigen ligase
VLVGYTLLLLADLVPVSLQQFIFWDGARLRPSWHPNMSACFFMMGIGFAAAFLVRSRKTWEKVFLVAAIAVQYMAMALTNCRTTLLMTGAFFGALAFFLIFKGGWKRFVLGLLAAVLILAGSFKLSGMLFSWNNSRLIAAVSEQQTEESSLRTEQDWEASVQPNRSLASAVPNLNEEILQGDNPQGSLTDDMRTLNGRTYIWKSAFQAIRDNKRLALFGTEYSGTVISVYNPFEVVHGHNSWVEAQLRMGLPGLLLSLVFTALALWSGLKLILNPGVEIWKKIIAMLTMCVMATGFLEPYLFITNVYYHVTDFAFFFLTGYLDRWANNEK